MKVGTFSHLLSQFMPLKSVVWIGGTDENNFKIKQNLARYLKEIWGTADMNGLKVTQFLLPNGAGSCKYLCFPTKFLGIALEFQSSSVSRLPSSSARSGGSSGGEIYLFTHMENAPAISPTNQLRRNCAAPPCNIDKGNAYAIRPYPERAFAECVIACTRFP